MATVPVFVPVTGASAKVGATVTLTTVSAANVAGTITITGPKEANGIVVTNAGTSGKGTGTLVFARISGEAVPVATVADVPVPPGQMVVVQNPVPIGTVGIAVKSTGATATINTVYFTPVEIKLGT